MIQVELDREVYRVVPVAGKYQVRCTIHRHGQPMTEELVNTFDYKSVADEIAKALTEGDGHGD